MSRDSGFVQGESYCDFFSESHENKALLTAYLLTFCNQLGA